MPTRAEAQKHPPEEEIRKPELKLVPPEADEVHEVTDDQVLEIIVPKKSKKPRAKKQSPPTPISEAVREAALDIGISKKYVTPPAEEPLELPDKEVNAQDLQQAINNIGAVRENVKSAYIEGVNRKVEPEHTFADVKAARRAERPAFLSQKEAQKALDNKLALEETRRRQAAEVLERKAAAEKVAEIRQLKKRRFNLEGTIEHFQSQIKDEKPRGWLDRLFSRSPKKPQEEIEVLQERLDALRVFETQIDDRLLELEGNDPEAVSEKEINEALSAFKQGDRAEVKGFTENEWKFFSLGKEVKRSLSEVLPAESEMEMVFKSNELPEEQKEEVRDELRELEARAETIRNGGDEIVINGETVRDPGINRVEEILRERYDVHPETASWSKIDRLKLGVRSVFDTGLRRLMDHYNEQLSKLTTIEEEIGMRQLQLENPMAFAGEMAARAKILKERHTNISHEVSKKKKSGLF